MQLKGKVAVITGGDSGIGLASARLFLEEGANVVVMSNNADTLHAARGQLGAKVMTIEADVTDANGLGDSFAEVGPQFDHIDALLASAGVVSPTPLEGASSELVERILRINIALFLASEYSRSMQAAEIVIDGGVSRAPQGAPAYRP